MTANQIMNNDAWRNTQDRTVWDYSGDIYDATDYYDDWLESRVMVEDTLNEWDFVEEAMK